MNVSTLRIPEEVAQAKLDAYKNLQAKQRTEEDLALERMYKRIAAGALVLDLGAAFAETGLNDLGQPLLAVARADWRTVHFHPRASWRSNWDTTTGAGGFSQAPDWNAQAKLKNILVPRGTFDNAALAHRKLKSPVPHIPPDIRPKSALSNFHILFEVDSWTAYPVDPFLLRRIDGMMFVIEAEWELSPLEAKILAGLRGEAGDA